MYCCSGKRRIEDWQVTGKGKQKVVKESTNKPTDKATVSSRTDRDTRAADLGPIGYGLENHLGGVN